MKKLLLMFGLISFLAGGLAACSSGPTAQEIAVKTAADQQAGVSAQMTRKQ